MGLLWELFQELQISKRKGDGASLEDRVAELEDELIRLESILEPMVRRLETITGEDLDGDGASGSTEV
jgi:hypothetical protein